MKNKLYIFDFDGTLVDCWQRYYYVFLKLLNITNSTLSFADYKRYKLELEKDEYIAQKISLSLPKKYFENKHYFLESKSYLNYDKLIINKNDIVNIFQSYNCIILTKRRNPVLFKNQIYWFGLDKIIKLCHIINPDDNISKINYFYANFQYDKCTIFGDSKEEYEFSKNVENKVYLFKTGLNNVNNYYKCDNVIILDNINQIVYNGAINEI